MTSQQPTSTAATDELTQLIVIYDKVCQTLLSCPVESDLLDVYTLYDFVSVILIEAIRDLQGPLNTKSTNTQRLSEVCSQVHDVPASFFDCDKLYYDKTEIAQAMSSAGCTEVQQDVLCRNIKRLFQSSQFQRITRTSSYSNSEQPYGHSQTNSVKDTQV